MFNFTSLNNKICAFNQFFNEGKDGVNLKRKAVVITMFFVIIGASLATTVATATATANPDTSSTTIARRPRPVPPVPPVPPFPPNGEGSDEP